MTKQKQIKSIESKLKQDRARRDRLLALSFRNPDSFEAKNRKVLTTKAALLIREGERRLKSLRN